MAMQRTLIAAALGLGLTSLTPASSLAAAATAPGPGPGPAARTVTAGDPARTITLGDSARTSAAGNAARTIPAGDAAVAALAGQARFWYGEGRDDLAEESVAKLFRIAPENLQGLEVLARVELRRRHPDAVRKLLDRMRRVQPDAAEIRRVEAAMRVDTDDRDALRRIRELSRANRNAEAVSALRSLYPDGMPTEDLTLEYWRIVAGTANGQARARAGLQALTQQDPGNLRYRLARDELLTARAPVDRNALARIVAMTAMPNYAKQARAAWRRAMLALDDSGASVALLRAYLLEEKNDSAVQDRLDRMTAGAAGRRRLLAADAAPALPSPPLFSSAAGAPAASKTAAAPVRASTASAASASSATAAKATSAATSAPVASAAAIVPTAEERASLLRAQADTLTAAGKSEAAIAALESAIPLAPGDPWLRYDLARLYARRNAAGDTQRADALFDVLLARQPADPATLYAYALIDESRDRPQAALATLQRMPPAAREPKVSALQRRLWVTQRLRRADALAAEGRHAHAETVLSDTATAIGPDPDLAPRVAQAQADARRAAAVKDAPDSGKYRALAETLDANSAWLAGAVDLRTRSGSAGKSQYAMTETPLEYRRPWRDGNRVFMQAAIVHGNAGTLDLAATGDAARFGSVLLCQPVCGTGGVAQTVDGLGLMAGIERDGQRADIGVTPLGFPVQNLVGGVLQKGDLGAFSYSVDASRRAVTGSVLSYAGARDPRTGAVWGGVLANGVRFGLSRDDGGSFGAWSSLGLHRLTGRNVQANDRMQLMGGAYWRVINEDDRQLSVGSNLLYWRFSQNAGEYTFGHGGYYSPQRFASLALPVTFGQRTARLSYTIRGALSASRSTTAGADYFPTRPDLQAQADALQAVGGSDAHYTASTGRGVGRSLAAAIEYQLQPKLFVGGRFEIDRSTDYAPNRLLLYFRYDLDRSAARPVALPPEPLTPASQF
jgi:tetratricopeptide (TPR) repeat protein